MNLLNSKHVYKTKANEVLAQSVDVFDEQKFWKEHLEKTPTYIPGLTELAKIEFQLGNKSVAVELLGKARSLNPNDERVRTAAEIISQN